MTTTPHPATADLHRVSELLRAGQIRAAHDQLLAIVEAHPQFVEALRLLAGAKQALGDAQAAEALLRKALELQPAWTPSLGTLGELLLGSGRNAEAEPLLQKAVAGNPPFPRAALLLARFYNDTGRPAEAVATAGPFCTGAHLDAQLAAQHINGLVALGRGQECVSIYQKMVTAQPQNPTAAHALAIALSACGHPVEASQVAERTLARGHRSAELFNTYARSLIAQGSLDRAESALQECVQREPRLIEAHTNLARLVWMRTGKAAEATASIDRALQNFPNDEALWATKAAVLQGTGDARGAHACLATIASRPQAPPSLLLRASLAALEFDPATALSYAERALRLAPDNAAGRTVLAAAQLGVGEATSALATCERLLQRTPDDQYLIALQTTAWRLLGDERYRQLCDYPNLVLPLQLDPPAGWPNMEQFLADLRISLNRLHDPQGHALLFQSLRHGTETTQDLTRSEDPAIRGLFASFASPIRRYLERIGAGHDPLRRRNAGRWRFNGSWSVRLRTSGFHTSHVHPRGWISSACYIELPDVVSDTTDQAGVLTFGVPSIPTTPALSIEHSVRPEPGMLVLFPSYFWHGTVPFHSEQPRLTVAFDAVPDR